MITTVTGKNQVTIPAELAREWAKSGQFDALVSADGDSDRPLVSDENGNWLRGDVAGILCAKFLGADSVSTPVSCNTAVEKCGWFPEVRRTRIGSPYVIVSLQAATALFMAQDAVYRASTVPVITELMTTLHAVHK